MPRRKFNRDGHHDRHRASHCDPMIASLIARWVRCPLTRRSRHQSSRWRRAKIGQFVASVCLRTDDARPTPSELLTAASVAPPQNSSRFSSGNQHLNARPQRRSLLWGGDSGRLPCQAAPVGRFFDLNETYCVEPRVRHMVCDQLLWVTWWKLPVNCGARSWNSVLDR